MTLEEFKETYSKPIVITDKDLIRKLIGRMARVPTDMLYSEHAVIKRGEKKLPLRDEAMSYFKENVCRGNGGKLPETAGKLMAKCLKFSQTMNYRQNSDELQTLYDYISAIFKGYK